MQPNVPDGVEMFPLDLDPLLVRSRRCRDCRWWWCERVVVKGREVVREWHQGDCAWYARWSEPLWSDPALREALADVFAEAAGLERGGGAVPDVDARAPLRTDSLADVVTRIDDADPLFAGERGDVSVWDDPDRLTAQIWLVLAGPMSLDCYLRYGCPARSPTLSLASSAGLTPALAAEVAIISKGYMISGSVARAQAMQVHSAVNRSVELRMKPLQELGILTYASFPLVLGGPTRSDRDVGRRSAITRS